MSTQTAVTPLTTFWKFVATPSPPGGTLDASGLLMHATDSGPTPTSEVAYTPPRTYGVWLSCPISASDHTHRAWSLCTVNQPGLM